MQIRLLPRWFEMSMFGERYKTVIGDVVSLCWVQYISQVVMKKNDEVVGACSEGETVLEPEAISEDNAIYPNMLCVTVMARLHSSNATSSRAANTLMYPALRQPTSPAANSNADKTVGDQHCRLPFNAHGQPDGFLEPVAASGVYCADPRLLTEASAPMSCIVRGEAASQLRIYTSYV